MQKLHQVHKFFNMFLKRKMERAMKKYKNIETAFHKIKAATGISDPHGIVKKFLKRETTYTETLITIADFER